MQNLTSEYLSAHKDASTMLKRGEIKAYLCKFESGLGRVIYIETDQGWNPDPFYADVFHAID